VTTTTPPTERVGRYQLLEPIGIGPSGAVSRAKVFGVAGFERQFAVKRFHAELTATAAAALSAAARAYGSLEHPRIARMSEFGVAQGATFTAVEFVPGLDALRLVAEARLSGGSGGGLVAGGALALVSQAARAVGYAHGRGLTHLGLAPTNVIVTADGDIKITDFGILSASLPQRPIEVPRLAQRIPYLAPEQLANEKTSAATDVFALGVLAYELVTGARTFKGDTPQQVASAIMAGPPAEPPLPRPIVRVLQRCLARSPFERFPDARALADALDAALRVAPVPGTRKDIGAQVKETLDRLAALNEGQMSGMVALHLGTGPIRRIEDERGAGDVPLPGDPLATPYELAAADPALGGPAALAAAASTLPDLPRPMTTVPGLPPPPVPVPPGLGPPSIPPPPAPPPGPGNATLLGLGRNAPSIPTAIPISSRSSATATPPVPPPAIRRPGTQRDPDPPPATVESAIHPLDPSDLLFDPPPDDAGAMSDTVMAPDGTADHGEPPEVPDAATRAAVADADGAASAADAAQGDAATLPAESSADDFGDAPTHSLSNRDAAARIARAQPGPPLFDPIARPTPRPEPEPRHVLDEDRWFDEASAKRVPGGDPVPTHAPPSPSSRVAIPSPMPPSPSGRVALPASAASSSSRIAQPGSGRISSNPADSTEPAALGKTMLGFGAPATPPRATPPAPFPPAASLPPDRAPEDELPVPSLPPDRNAAVEPPGDQLSEMMLEGFRTAPAPEVLEIPPGWQEASSITQAPLGPEPTLPPSGWLNAPSGPPPGPAIAVKVPSQTGRRVPWVLVGMLGAAAVAVGAWQLYVRVVAPPVRSTQITTRPDRRAPAGSPDTAAVPPPVAPPVSLPISPPVRPPAAAAVDDAAPADAGAPPRDAAPPDAAAQVAVAPTTRPAPTPTPPTQPAPGAPGTSDSLSIASTPPGARVFLDGADSGVTPLKLPGSPDRHNIAVLLAGHELYVAQVDGHGPFHIQLKEVTPTNGPAGIKVLRCKDKDRYYIFLDGKPTGQTCPSERIGCELGPHTVEVYDTVSETRRKWDVIVKETRLSYRVRVE
jgi:serine/threonine protein kinase